MAFRLVLLLAFAVSQPSAEVIASEPEVRDAIVTFGEAFAAADTAVLSRLLTDTYIHINGRSGTVLDRGQWLAWAGSQRSRIENGSLLIRTYRVRDLSIVLYGTTAVATGIVFTEGDRDGSAFTSLIRFTNVWVNQGGSWRRAAFHDSPLPDDD